MVERTRLYRELDRLRKQHQVIWIQGPPGAGKTTLVTSYLRKRKVKPLWYQLDEGDADPGTWFHYLSLGMKQVAPRYKKPLPTLRLEYLPGLPTFTRRVFEELYRRLPSPGVVVFDNFHEVPEGGPFHQVLSVALQTIPVGVTVMVMSRQPFPATLARAQAEQRLITINPEALTFSSEEMKALVTLRGGKGHRPSSDRVQAIHEYTQGWVAGVVLLMNKESDGLVEESKSKQAISSVLFDYMAEEVLRTQGKTETEVLLHTAWFPSFTGSMAIQVSGENEASRILDRLARAHYFTERRSGAEPVYQYHPMFREFLRRQANEHWVPVQREEVQRHVGQLLEEVGRWEEALSHYQDTGHHVEAERVLLSQAPRLFGEGRALAVAGWLAQVPKLKARNPWLRYWEANCVFLRNPNESVTLFEGLYQEFKENQDEVGRWLAWCGAVDGVFFSFQNFDRFVFWFKEVLPHLEAGHDFPSNEIESRVTFALFGAMTWKHLSHPKLESLEKRVEAMLPHIPDHSQRVIVGTQQYVYWTFRGKMEKVDQLYHRLEQWYSESVVSPLAQMVFLNIRSNYGWYKGNAERCWAGHSAGRKLAEEYGIAMPLMAVQSSGFAWAILARDYEYGATLVEEMRRQSEHASGLQGAAYRHAAAYHAFLQEDFELASVHATKSVELQLCRDSEFMEAVTKYHYGEIFIESREWEKAEAQLARLTTLRSSFQSEWSDYFLFGLQARLAFARGNEEKGIEALTRWLAVCRTKKLWFPMFVNPKTISRLCVRALELGIEVEQAKFFVLLLNLVPEDPDVVSDDWPFPVKIYTLGRFELCNESGPIIFPRKVPRLPLALLKLLIALGGYHVAQSKVSDALWPDADGDAAYRSLITTVARLRKILGREEAIFFGGGELRLNNKICWVDCLNVDHLIGAAQGVDPASIQSEQHLAFAKRALQLYRGPLFPNNEEAWILSARTRLHQQYLALVELARAFYERNGQPTEAAKLLAQAQKISGA